MKSVIVDAGPLIALFDKDDRYHEPCVRHFQENRAELVRTWPVMAETCHLLDFSVDAQMDFLKWVSLGAVRLFPLETAHLGRVLQLTEKYRDRPMDLADASLIVAAEQLGIEEIISIDSDYLVYRLRNKKALRNVFRG